MSRTKRTETKVFPVNPISAYGYIDAENKFIQVKKLPTDVVPSGEMTIPFGAGKLLTLDTTFGKSYYNNQTKFKAHSTEYKRRELDRIAIFENGKYVLSTTADKAPTFDEGKKMGTVMFVYVYDAQSDLCFRLELTAIQRGVFFDFQKATREKYPTFCLNDMVGPVGGKGPDGKEAPKHWRFPVFELKQHNEQEEERANYYSSLLDEYFDTHPDFNSSKEPETKVKDNSQDEADAATLEVLENLERHEGDDVPNLEDVEDDIFEDDQPFEIPTEKGKKGK